MSTSLLCTRVVAGLPNITGNVYRDRNTVALTWSSGAFYNDNKDGDGNGTGGDAQSVVAVKMDASRLTPIYGSSNTVTPLSITTSFAIRY